MTIVKEDQTIPTIPHKSAGEEIPSLPLNHSRRKFRFGLGLTLAGYAIFLLGSKPSLYGLDRSPVIGFAQIAVFLFGLGIISVGAYTVMQALWQGAPISIVSQIGMRLLQTGFVIAIFTGLADVFGLGSHPLSKPFFGPLQAAGVEIGEVVIGIGIFLMFPFHRIFQRKREILHDQTIEENNSKYQ